MQIRSDMCKVYIKYLPYLICFINQRYCTYHKTYCMFCSPNWEKCAEVEGDVTTGKVPNLIEGNQYEFRVRAVNKAGPGEPSDATKPHIARPKRS